MTKTICDICGKEMIAPLIGFKQYLFCISSHGVQWDICNNCEEDLKKWIKGRKETNEENEVDLSSGL